MQVIAEVLDAFGLADVERVVGDGCLSAILGENFGVFELRVVLEFFYCGGASFC